MCARGGSGAKEAELERMLDNCENKHHCAMIGLTELIHGQSFRRSSFLFHPFYISFNVLEIYYSDCFFGY